MVIENLIFLISHQFTFQLVQDKFLKRINPIYYLMNNDKLKYQSITEQTSKKIHHVFKSMIFNEYMPVTNKNETATNWTRRLLMDSNSKFLTDCLFKDIMAATLSTSN